MGRDAGGVSSSPKTGGRHKVDELALRQHAGRPRFPRWARRPSSRTGQATRTLKRRCGDHVGRTGAVPRSVLSRYSCWLDALDGHECTTRSYARKDSATATECSARARVTHPLRVVIGRFPAARRRQRAGGDADHAVCASELKAMMKWWAMREPSCRTDSNGVRALCLRPRELEGLGESPARRPVTHVDHPHSGR